MKTSKILKHLTLKSERSKCRFLIQLQRQLCTIQTDNPLETRTFWSQKDHIQDFFPFKVHSASHSLRSPFKHQKMEHSTSSQPATVCDVLPELGAQVFGHMQTSVPLDILNAERDVPGIADRTGHSCWCSNYWYVWAVPRKGCEKKNKAKICFNLLLLLLQSRLWLEI